MPIRTGISSWTALEVVPFKEQFNESAQIHQFLRNPEYTHRDVDGALYNTLMNSTPSQVHKKNNVLVLAQD